MVDNTQSPDVGSGPYGVEHSEDDGFYHVTLDGERTGKSYPIGKTAYRAVRKLNEAYSDGSQDPAEALPREADTFLEEEPKASDFPDKKALEKAAITIGKKLLKPKAQPVPKPVIVVKEAPGVLEFSKVFNGTREQWLNAFADQARKVFKQHGLELPEKIRVSVGFMFRSPKAIGQCWAESASADGYREVFINPTQADSSRVADILTHELAHCLFGPEEKHGKNFKAAVTKLGLEGKATATVAGDAWRAWAFPILAKLGPIPHGALDPNESGVKKQSTRLLKCECDTCGFIFRATAKHVNGKRLYCPDDECGGTVRVDGAEEGDDE